MTTILRDGCGSYLPNWVSHVNNLIAAGRNGNGFLVRNNSSGGLYSAGSVYSIAAGQQTDTLTVGCAYKQNNITNTSYSITLGSDTGATPHMTWAVGNDGKHYVVRGGYAGTNIAGPSVLALTPGTFYYVEFQAKLSDTVGTYALRVNGTTILSASGADTKNAGTKTVFDWVGLYAGGSATESTYDDIYINNDATFLGDIGDASIPVGGTVASLVDLMLMKLAAHYPAMTNRSLDDFLQQFATDNPTYLRPLGSPTFYTQTQYESLSEAAVRWWTAYTP